MFSKNTEKLESFIGINSNFKGDIKTQGTLRVDGTVEGNIETDWLILGETSHLKGMLHQEALLSEAGLTAI